MVPRSRADRGRCLDARSGSDERGTRWVTAGLATGATGARATRSAGSYGSTHGQARAAIAARRYRPALASSTVRAAAPGRSCTWRKRRADGSCTRSPSAGVARSPPTPGTPNGTRPDSSGRTLRRRSRNVTRSRPRHEGTRRATRPSRNACTTATTRAAGHGAKTRPAAVAATRTEHAAPGARNPRVTAHLHGLGGYAGAIPSADAQFDPARRHAPEGGGGRAVPDESQEGKNDDRLRERAHPRQAHHARRHRRVPRPARPAAPSWHA